MPASVLPPLDILPDNANHESRAVLCEGSSLVCVTSECVAPIECEVQAYMNSSIGITHSITEVAPSALPLIGSAGNMSSACDCC